MLRLEGGALFNVFPLVVGSVTLTGQTQIWFFNPSASKAQQNQQATRNTNFPHVFFTNARAAWRVPRTTALPNSQDSKGHSWLHRVLGLLLLGICVTIHAGERCRFVRLFRCLLLPLCNVFFVALLFLSLNKLLLATGYCQHPLPSPRLDPSASVLLSPSESFELWAEVRSSGPKHGNKHKKAGKPNAP